MSCKILRIGVFFDGTGNSKIPDSSKGKMSNIAKLSDMYKKEEFVDKFGKKTTPKMLYTNGVGTYDSDIVNFFNIIDRKYDKGGGGGGAERINKMIDDVAAILDTHQYSKSDDAMFIKREIDVFGFSRGAAMARDFVNTFFKKKITKNKNYGDVSFNFIGIYDTVGSFGVPGNDQDFKPKREYQKYFSEDYRPDGMDLSDENFGIRDPDSSKKARIALEEVKIGFFGKKELEKKMEAYSKNGWEVSFETADIDENEESYVIYGSRPQTYFFEPYNFNLSVASANKIVHMTAHNEVRKNFPLTDVRDSSGEEWTLMGVHSDVGGGYATKTVEEFVYDDVYYNEKRAKEKAKALAMALNIKSLPFTQFDRWSAVDAESETNNGITIYHPKLQKVISNDLSLITLYLMYEQAIKYNVPLNEPTEALPEYLNEYYEYARVNKSRAYTFDEKEKGEALRDALSHHPARDPAHKYDHKISTVSMMDGILHDEPESGNDARYVDKNGNVVDGRVTPALADHVERAIYPNKPSLAISKLENV